MSFQFLDQPALRPIPGSEMYCLDEDYIIFLPVHKKRLKIWAGFVTDGASIPRTLWALIGNPFSPNVMAPALVHDALYRAELFPRRECDQELSALMKMNGRAAANKAGAFYLGVRLGGWWVWFRHRKRSIIQARELVEIIDDAEVNPVFV